MPTDEETAAAIRAYLERQNPGQAQREAAYALWEEREAALVMSLPPGRNERSHPNPMLAEPGAAITIALSQQYGFTEVRRGPYVDPEAGDERDDTEFCRCEHVRLEHRALLYSGEITMGKCLSCACQRFRKGKVPVAV